MRQWHAVALLVRRVEGGTFQRLAGVDVAKQPPLCPGAAAGLAEEGPPQHQRVHRPGIVGVLADALADGGRQGLEGGPGIARQAVPEAGSLGDVVIVEARGQHAIRYNISAE